MNARELLEQASRSLTDARFNAMQNPLSAGQQAMVDRWAELRSRIDAYLAAPSESAMETVGKIHEIYKTADYEGYMAGWDQDSTKMIFDKADSDVAALIEGYGRRVPRAMLREIYREGGDDIMAVMADESIDEIAAKHGVEVD